jgi:phosphate transport system permease protein
MFEQIAQSRLALALLAGLLAAASAAFFMGRSRAVALAGGDPSSLHSRPNYHGYLVALWTLGPSLAVLTLYAFAGNGFADKLALGSMPSAIAALSPFEQTVQVDAARALASGAGTIAADNPLAGSLRELAQSMAEQRGAVKFYAALAAGAFAILGLVFGLARVRKDRRARNRVETAIKAFLMLCSGVAIFTTIGIVLSLIFETMRFFGEVSPLEFLFGLKWSAQTNIRPDQIGASGAFGAVPLIYGSLMITLIAMIVAAPVGLYAAIYLSEYAGPRMRRTVKPILEVLAGVPTVVYGFFALLTVAPAVRAFGDWLNDILMALMPWIEGPIVDAPSGRGTIFCGR